MTEPADRPFDTEEMREYARAVFGRQEAEQAPPEAQQQQPGDHVPGEGTNPDADDGDRELRRAVARIFGTPDQDQI